MIQLSLKELKARLNADSEPKPIDTTSSQTIAKPNVSGSASDFEKDLYKLINSYVDAGLKKPDLVHKMVYVTETCRVS